MDCVVFSDLISVPDTELTVSGNGFSLDIDIPHTRRLTDCSFEFHPPFPPVTLSKPSFLPSDLHNFSPDTFTNYLVVEFKSVSGGRQQFLCNNWCWYRPKSPNASRYMHWSCPRACVAQVSSISEITIAGPSVCFFRVWFLIRNSKCTELIGTLARQ